MATHGLGIGQARRHKWLTGLVVAGICLTALAVSLSYWGSAVRRRPPAQNLPSPAPDVHQQLSGYTFTRSDRGRAVFTVHAARTVAYQRNKFTMLEDVTVEVFGRKGGNSDILRTERCEYNPQSGDFVSDGPVEIELGAHSSDLPGTGLQGKHRVYLETSKVAYHQKDQQAETDEPVKFRMGPATGTALGMVYATRDGWIELKHNVVADLQQGTDQNVQPAIHLTASALRYDKEGGRVTLAGPVEVREGDRRAVGENASIELNNHNRVSRVSLQGNAQAFDVTSLRTVTLSANLVQGDFDPATGELRHLTAQQNVVGESKGKGSTSSLTAERFDMDLNGKHPQPHQGVATGNVHINLESQPVLDVSQKNPATNSPEKKTLTAAEVEFHFRPDTHGLKDAETIGPGTLLVSPADPKTGEKIITAGQFLMTFDARSRIESLRGTAPTQVLFRPPATAPPGSTTQWSKADHLDALFDVGTQTLREVVQAGNFQYHNGDRQAIADKAIYSAKTQDIVLLGRPEVWDPDTRIRCQRMTIYMPTDTAVGEGHVQATHSPSPAPGATSATTPALPTNVLADKMVVQWSGKTVHYEGHVRAWQGTDVLESSALDMDRAQRRLSSGSHVVTSFLQAAAMVNGQRDTAHSAGGAHPVTIRADHLEYFDQGRRARYDGDVRLVTESTTLRSDRLDVYFSQGEGTAEGSQVDRAVADGHVRVTQPGRRGTGDHAEYFAGSGKIVLTGGPPLLVDDKKGSTTGERLTFFIHDDRLFVDGGGTSPSLN